jgi:sulfide dehydrogenase [flavocytochrome c] flavoprotein subunit
VRVDPKAMQVETASGTKLKGAVVNVIPPQTAGAIAISAGCAEGAWCPIKPDNFLSAKVDGIYVIGDAAIAVEMPKSAYTANSHGKSLLAAEDSIKIGADYKPGEHDGKQVLVPDHPFVSQKGETAEVRRKNYAEGLAWYHAIIADAFNDNTALTHKG